MRKFGSQKSDFMKEIIREVTTSGVFFPLYFLRLDAHHDLQLRLPHSYTFRTEHPPIGNHSDHHQAEKPNVEDGP